MIGTVVRWLAGFSLRGSSINHDAGSRLPADLPATTSEALIDVILQVECTGLSWRPGRNAQSRADMAPIGSQTLLTTSGFRNTHADVNSRVFDRLGNRGLKFGRHRSGQLSQETRKRGNPIFP
ncbi:hypothetical protein ABZW30_39955 [Kitasatospora sp. NPDC004669]|uniref:hypothetical protein n=1 Tax=Kitasatospora sp. NPDC004669 TaxID=3154555 RepID=UPI0033B9F3C2